MHFASIAACVLLSFCCLPCGCSLLAKKKTIKKKHFFFLRFCSKQQQHQSKTEWKRVSVYSFGSFRSFLVDPKSIVFICFSFFCYHIIICLFISVSFGMPSVSAALSLSFSLSATLLHDCLVIFLRFDHIFVVFFSSEYQILLSLYYFAASFHCLSST